MQLKGKTAIITGAAGGIGRATALRFVAEGARVVAADIQGEGAEETAHIAGANHANTVIAHTVDVSQGDQVERLISETISHFGQLDIIFSNAAIMRDGSVVDLPEADWDALFDANVKGAFLCGKYGIPAMRQSGGGSFIITASVNSFYAESDIAGYCATKGAVLQLTRAMAIDHGPEGVRVNCICPRLDRNGDVATLFGGKPRRTGGSQAPSLQWDASANPTMWQRWPCSLQVMRRDLSQEPLIR